MARSDIGFFPASDAVTENRKYFNNLSSSPIFLKNLRIGEVLYTIEIVVTQIFDNGFKVSVGIPGTPELLIGQDESKLQTLYTFWFDFYRESIAAETVNIYIYGSSTGGSGYVYIGTK